MSDGQVFFVLDSGEVNGPFQGMLTLSTPKDGYYLDVRKATEKDGYPSKLDIQGRRGRKVTGIEFRPNMGRPARYSAWTLRNNGAWPVDRFIELR
ncbi:MAG: hypothetical protein V4653_04180 [Pseudomonadota bacterium]